jgi:hypothetical protein
MGKPRDEWGGDDGRDRRDRHEKVNSCEDCGENGGRRRFERGIDLGFLCDSCWRESQAEADLASE